MNNIGMGPEAVMDVLRHLIRVPSLYRTYRGVITPECFHAPAEGIYIGEDYAELPLLIIWQGLNLYYAEQSAEDAPSKTMLRHYVSEVIRRGVWVDEDLRTRLLDSEDPQEGFLAYMFDAVDINSITGAPLIKTFLHERMIQPELGGICTNAEQELDSAAAQLGTLADKAWRIRSLGVGYTPSCVNYTQAFFDSLDPEPGRKTTGFQYMDQALGGEGQRVGDCYALMGATGSGKSTMVAQLAFEAARAAFLEAPEGQEPEKVLIYQIEEPTFQAYRRLLSYGARIERNRIHIESGTVFGVREPTRNPLAPQPYEVDLFPNAETRKSELQRLHDFQCIASKTLVIRNFSGIADTGDSEDLRRIKRSLGQGGIREIHDDARSVQEALGTGIRSIFIDYIGLTCQRAAKTEDQLYSLLCSAGDECMNIAGSLHTTVWAAHQLSGVAAGASATRMPSSSDAAGCKSLINNMAAAFVLGTPAQNAGDGPCVYFRAVKQRYAGSTKAGRGMILQHDKYIYRLNDVTEFYRPDNAHRVFVPRRGYNEVVVGN